MIEDQSMVFTARFDIAPSRVRRVGIIGLVVVVELAAMALAQLSAVVGLVALLALACVQAIAAMRADARTGKLLLVAASLSFAAAATSAAAIAFRKDIRVVADRGLLQRGGVLGWTLEPGVTHITRFVNGKPLYTQTFTVGADGQRHTLAAPDGPTIAFLGDSFTFGDGVADIETMPQAFADLTGRKFRVANLGVDGYSPAQTLRAFELGLYDTSLQPTKALFLLTLGWHAARVACAHESLVGAPRYVRQGATVRFAGACEPPPPPSLPWRLAMATPLAKAFVSGLRHVGDDEVQTYIDVMVAADRSARARYGVPLRILYLRNPGYLIFNSLGDDAIIAQLRRRGVLVYDLTLPREGRGEFAIPQDGHPSALGHRLHARMLVDALNRTEPALLHPSSEAAARTSMLQP